MLRLLHLTATLLSGYAHMLRTEAEIILSMLARTLDADATPIWHRALILEVFRVLVQAPRPALSPQPIFTYMS